MSSDRTDPRRDWVIDAVYKAIGQYEEAKRVARGLRAARNGKGPTIKRGTGRGALAVHVTDAVIAALHQWDEHEDASTPPLMIPATSHDRAVEDEWRAAASRSISTEPEGLLARIDAALNAAEHYNGDGTVRISVDFAKELRAALATQSRGLDVPKVRRHAHIAALHALALRLAPDPEPQPREAREEELGG